MMELVDGVRYCRVGHEVSFLWRLRTALRRLCAAQPFDLVIDDISKLPLAVHRQVALPTIGWCHHIHGRSLYRQLPWPMAHAADRWERTLPHRYADVPMLAVSRSTRAELIELGLSPGRIGYVHNAVDASAIQRDATQKADDPLLLYLGRLQPYKNVDCVLRAFGRIRAACPNAALAVVGSGPDQPRLRRLSQRLGLHGVTFHGHVDQQHKHHLLHRAWLSLASSSKEGWGICVLEANAAGTPVIASDVPGHRDAVMHEKTGLLYPFDDEQALAEAALRCIHDRDALRALGRQARRWASGFNWDQSVEQLLRWTAHFYPHLALKLGIFNRANEQADAPVVSDAPDTARSPVAAAL